MTHLATPLTGTVRGSARAQRTAADHSAPQSLLQGAAFVLLCLWTRTAPERLRDQLAPEAGDGATLGF
ncbi:hypothetical protein LOK46_03330 [Methylobacterium sp. NMS14P]|uniref:hypothetical protein n=1 Tax=unclassified Methylobacterium TaxID=2615210 RepID=UPI002359767B|nr:hypothetical protein [Methylobacterium sp. NMS14P]WCS25883.1 hypothetical protein LOK46_03330 [Methylobacterium sp. NMS14P]